MLLQILYFLLFKIKNVKIYFIQSNPQNTAFKQEEMANYAQTKFRNTKFYQLYK